MGKLLDSTKSSKETSNENQTAPRNIISCTSKTNNTNANNKTDSEALSASLVTSVNIAAETARLVLDQSSQPFLDNMPMNPSPLSNVQEREQDDSTANWGGDNSFNKTVTFSSPIPHSNSKSTLGGKLDVSVSSELTENSALEETSKVTIPGSSPPPLAFQNLPMGRYTPVSNHSETNNEGNTRPSEITNHYDAAAVISAALASSHLAQASHHGVGELQKSLVASKKKGFSRDESFTDDSLRGVVLTPSNYTPQSHNKESVKEAHVRRCSYDSDSDESFTDYLSKAYDDKSKPNDNMGDDLFMECASMPNDDKGEPESQPDRVTEKIEEPATQIVDNVTEEKVEQNTGGDTLELQKAEGEIAHRKSIQTEGGDSISICSSNGRSSQFENESNTSSYGSSDYSPITMSFGSSSDDGKSAVQGGYVTGMLGNLAPMAAAVRGDASYGTTDEEDNNHGERGSEKVTSISSPQPLEDKPSKCLAPSRTPLKMEDKPSEQMPASSLPINQQYISLFESFDRNLAQSLEDSPDKDIMLDLSQNFLSSFVAVLGAIDIDKKQSGNKESNNKASNTDTGLTHYDWWYEDTSEILGYNLKIVADDEGERVDALLDRNIEQKQREDEEEEEEEKLSIGIPIAVIRCMWKSCFFDHSNDNANEETVQQTLDFIQNNLLNMHYLSKTSVRGSPASSLPCMFLSLPLYKDYASYLLLRRHIDSNTVEETVSAWHYKFAATLHSLLLRQNTDNDNCEMFVKDMNDTDCKFVKHNVQDISFVWLYSNRFLITVLTLRRYAAYSLPRHAALGMSNAVQNGNVSMHAMQTLLCDPEFFKARIDYLLGHSRKRLQLLNESLDAEDDEALIETIKKDRERTFNYLPATTMHIADVERSLPLKNNDRCINTRGKDTIEPLTKWRQQLLLICSEKTTSAANGTEEYGESSHDRNDEILKVAKILLSKDDAWSNNTSEESIQSKKSSRSRRNRSENIDPTTLANAINTDILQIKANVSTGRSILSLAKFTQRLSSLGCCSVSPSTLQEEVALCLRDSIEVLSSASKTLHIILSDSLSNLEEEDLDDSLLSSSGSGASCLQKLALTRAEAKPLLTLTGIFLAEAWFLLGRMTSTQSINKTHKHKLLMVACFDRALVILSSPKEVPKNYLMEPLNKHKDFLYCNVNHAMGVCLYEAGIYDRSGRCLKDAISLRRKLLDKLRNEKASHPNKNQTSGILATFSSYFFSSPQTVSEDMMSNVMQYSVYQCCSLLPKLITVKSKADDLELSLSLTLEYTALTNHANQSYQTALACFQEALVLRSLHVGKNSLDIASLHFNTGKKCKYYFLVHNSAAHPSIDPILFLRLSEGVVHDDLEQYQQATNRYHESLRIRLNHLKTAPSGESSEIEDSVLLTLKCIAHVYKLQGKEIA